MAGSLASILPKGRKMYRGLRRRGYSKQKSARIANAYANGSLRRGRRRR